MILNILKHHRRICNCFSKLLRWKIITRIGRCISTAGIWDDVDYLM